MKIKFHKKSNDFSEWISPHCTLFTEWRSSYHMTFTLVVWFTRYYRLIMSQLYFLGSLINYYVKERNRPGESNVSIQTKLRSNLRLCIICSPRLISNFCCFLKHLLLSVKVKYKNMIKSWRNNAKIQIIRSANYDILI